MDMSEIVASPDWEEVAAALPEGTAMVVGATDTGKSSFARWLCTAVSRRSRAPVALLDGDPGQSTMGPPATVNVAMLQSGRVLRRFLGSVTPRGHMLQLLAAVARLAEAARAEGARTMVLDTTGLVDPVQGAVALKLAEIDLLRPHTLIAIRREDELEPLLAPLRISGRLRVVDLRPSAALRPRNLAARQHYRAQRFAACFASASVREFDLAGLALLPQGRPERHQLAAFEDEAGMMLGLGIVMRTDMESRRIEILTDLRDSQIADALRLGSLRLDPETYRDYRPA